MAPIDHDPPTSNLPTALDVEAPAASVPPGDPAASIVWTAATAPPPWRWLWLLAVTPALRWLIIRFAVTMPSPWRTSCDTCKAALHPNGAAWPAVLPTARCGRCGHRLGAPAYAVEAGTVIAVAAAAVSTPEPLVMAAALWWGLCAVPLAFVDLLVHRLPNPLTYAATAGVLALLTAAATTGRWPALAGALVSAAVTVIVFLVIALLLGARGMGLGDVKLAASIAALAGWWGWGTAFTVILLAFVISGITGVTLLATRRANRHSQIPLGPSFIVAMVTMLGLLALT